MNRLHSTFLILLCAGTVVGDDSSTTAKNSPWAFWNKEIAKTLAAKNRVEVHMAEKNNPASSWEQFTVTSKPCVWEKYQEGLKDDKPEISFCHRIFKGRGRQKLEDLHRTEVQLQDGELREFHLKYGSPGASLEPGSSKTAFRILQTIASSQNYSIC